MEYVCYYDNRYDKLFNYLVGYGDYYPQTNIGRMIIGITALAGIILISLITVSLQDFAKLEEYEGKVFDFISRMEAKAEITKEAGYYFHKTFKYFLEKKKFLRIVRDKKKTIGIQQHQKMKKKLLDNLYNKLSHKRRFKNNLQYVI